MEGNNLFGSTNTKEILEIANYNSPQQIVVSGTTAALQFFCEKIAALKAGKTIPLRVSAPFHSSLMQPAAQRLKDFLQDVPLLPLQIPLVANLDAKLYQGNSYTKSILENQLVSSVQWTQSLETLAET